MTGAKVARHTLTPANLDLPPGAISGGGADVMGGTSFFLSPNQCQPCAIPPLGLSPGPLGNVQAAVSTSAARGTASQLSVTVTSPPGSGSGWQFMLVDYLSQRILLSCSIVNSNATCTDTTDHASFAAGALLYFLASAHGQPQPALAKFGWRESP